MQPTAILKTISPYYRLRISTVMSFDKEVEPIIVDDQDVEDFVEPDRDFNSDDQLGEIYSGRAKMLWFTDFRSYTARDENDAIDQSNINDKNNRELRHAKPQTANAYNEGPNEDDLPEEAL